MKSLALIVLLALLSFTSAVNWGQPVECTKDQPCVIELIGSTLNITLDSNANVTVSLYLSTNAQLSLPNGLIPLYFAVSAGFTVDVAPETAVVLSAHFVTPAVAITSLGQLTTDMKAGCLKYDSNLNWYNTFEIEGVDLKTYQIAVNIPSAGTYVFAAFNSSAILPALYDFENKLEALVQYVYQYPNGFYISVTSKNNNTLLVTSQTTNPKSKDADNKVVYGRYWNIIAQSDNTVNATLVFNYNTTVAKAKGIKENTLRMAFYNENSQSWEFLSAGGYVNTSSGAIVQVTPHFSTWSAYGDSESTTSGSTTGGSTAATTGSDDSAATLAQVSVALISVLSILISNL